jgi:hypothetical protein
VESVKERDAMLRRGRGRASVWIGTMISWLGGGLLLVGAVVGWAVPLVGKFVSSATGLDTPIPATIDLGGYLGAYLTALAVMIAVVIGFNATTLQIAGQAHSLSLVRAILLSLGPFFLCWSFTTLVALIYFLEPPSHIAQMWQLLLWFGAVVLLMIGYLWGLPWRLSGEYAARWAVRELRRQPINRWEPLDGYAVLQSGMSAAFARGDISTVRAMAMMLGNFLTAARDRRAEAANTYDRGRYRALKNLLSGTAQNVSAASNASVYYLGYVVAGVILLGSAVGLPFGDDERDIYSGLFRALRGAPERMDALWTGMRHGLCRRGEHDGPYLLRYWRIHAAWVSDDSRRIEHVATGIRRLYSGCVRELQRSDNAEQASLEGAELLKDLYRDLAVHLAPLAVHAHGGGKARLADLPAEMLDAIHTQVLATWPPDGSAARLAVINAYEARRRELAGLLHGATSPTADAAVRAC